MLRYWWIVALPVVAVLAWEGGQSITDNGMLRYFRTIACRAGVLSCRIEYPVVVRTRADSAGPVTLVGRKVFVAGAASADKRFPHYKTELEERVVASGGAVVSSALEADLQLSLSYEVARHFPAMRGWGPPTKFIAIDLSHVRPAPPGPTYAGRNRVSFGESRQVHFLVFGNFVSMDIAVQDSIDLMFASLSDIALADWTTTWRSISFARTETRDGR